MIVKNITTVDINKPHYIAAGVARRNFKRYVYSDAEILEKYQGNIKEFGKYTPEIADAMGDKYFFARFDKRIDAIEFSKVVREIEK